MIVRREELWRVLYNCGGEVGYVMGLDMCERGKRKWMSISG